MSYPNVPITQTPDWVRRAGQAINYLLNNPSGGGGTTTNALTMNNGGAGAASGSTFNGSAPVTISYNTIGAQPLDGTLTALAAVNWSAGTQVPTLTAADTFTLKTVGTAAGNILDKAAGDSLYQPLNSNLTGLAALTLSQGDILYRDGSGLQRLAAGTSGQVLQTNGAAANPSWVTPLSASSGASGTAFPGSPATGDRFFRTDRGIEYYYDGTRWLSVQQFAVGPSFTGFATAGTSTLYVGIPHAETYDIYIDNLLFHSQLTTGTTASNYFTFTFYSITSTGTGVQVGTAQSTQNDTQQTVYARSQAVGQVIDMTNSQKAMAFTLARTGTATVNGSLTFNYRVVG